MPTSLSGSPWGEVWRADCARSNPARPRYRNGRHAQNGQTQLFRACHELFQPCDRCCRTSHDVACRPAARRPRPIKTTRTICKNNPGRQTMKKLTAALCALAFLATGAQAQTVKDFLAVVTKKWTTPFEPFQLIGNIYYVGTDGIAVYVIKTSEGLILMDTAVPQSTGMIKDNIAKLGFKVADIKYILNSHAHFDHTGGFAGLKKETGAQLTAGEPAKPLLESGTYPGDEKDTDIG